MVVAARAALASMRACSPTARLVVMPALVALVERVALRVPLDQMPRRLSAALAAQAATPGLLVLVRRVRLEQLAHQAAAPEALAAMAELAALVGIAEPAALAAVVVLGRAAAVVWA